jgi:Flp pilus assembly protein TadB
MTTKMPRSLRHWEITRETGRTKFILIDGILRWGVLMFILMTFCVEPQRWHTPLTAKSVIVSACIWIVAGAVFGWLVWMSSERKYKKFKEELHPKET